MRIYWSINSVPELAGLSLQEREQVLKAVRSKALRHWQTWVAMVAFIVWLLVVVSQVDSIRGGQSATLLSVLVGVAAVAIPALLVSHVNIQMTRPYIRALLKSSESSTDGDAKELEVER